MGRGSTLMGVRPAPTLFRGWDITKLMLMDLAFGLFARALPKSDEFLGLHANVAGLELADSIAADGHKLLNVVCHSQYLEVEFCPDNVQPYDNGIFLCRH